MLGIFALSGALRPEQKDLYQKSINLLEEKGFAITLADNLEKSSEIFSKADYFSCGNVDERIIALKKLDSNNLLSLKGGYGAQQCFDKLDLSFFDKKSIFAYSDLTALFLKLYDRDVNLYHSPMLVELAELSEAELNSFLAFLNGTKDLKKSLLELTPKLEDKLKEASSQFLSDPFYLWGGNLSLLLTDMLELKLKQGYKNLLFIEDCDEEAYKIERMLFNLENSGVLKTIDELWLGEPRDAVFNIDLLESFSEKYNFTLVQDLPFGHKSKFTLPIFTYYD